METGFWADRWHTGQIAFHQGVPNPLLVEHHARIAGDRRVYLPLCGKAVDLVWLRDQGHEVTGCELVPLAIQQLFKEQTLLPTTTTRGSFRLHLTPRLAVLEGDALQVDVDVLGLVDAVYDRAALVAVDPADRAAYVDSLMRVLKPGGHVLLITFDYDQKKIAGPPWAVGVDEVTRLFGAACTIEQLGSRRETPAPKLAAAGVDDVVEAVFLLQKR
ncbi:MAG: methyltransferase domain-containing protein [Deltaproteobacteria bacterium]|nr:methyltransferase domain-containing protein [Deltaproteobacteria bacterium]